MHQSRLQLTELPFSEIFTFPYITRKQVQGIEYLSGLGCTLECLRRHNVKPFYVSKSLEEKCVTLFFRLSSSLEAFSGSLADGSFAALLIQATALPSI